MKVLSIVLSLSLYNHKYILLRKKPPTKHNLKAKGGCMIAKT